MDEEFLFDPTYGGYFGEVVGENVFDPNFGVTTDPVFFENDGTGTTAGGGFNNPNVGSILYENDGTASTTTGAGGVGAGNMSASASDAIKLINADTSGLLRKLFVDDKGNLNLKTLGGVGGGILGALGALSPNTKRSGYQGSIPKYEAVRNMVTAPPTKAQGYRPGQGGVNWGGDVSYVPKGSAAAAAPSSGGGSSMLGDLAKVAGVGGLGYLAGKYLTGENSPFKGINTSPLGAAMADGSGGSLGRSIAEAIGENTSDKGMLLNQGSNGFGDFGNMNTDESNAMDRSVDWNASFAGGGLTNLAKGRYLQGETDGMADKIPARIGRDQPAALSHGEFVVPADVVSHLGNGNSDAGAKKLYSMMDKIREARTGTKKQGKQINPDKFMPGGLAQAYASGGSVQRFNTGGTASTTGLGSAAAAGVTGSETGPNTWAGEYMSDMLGKGQALASAPYQQYMGPLTAGESGLQSKVFGGLQSTNFPGNLGQSFSSAGAYQAPQLNMDAYKTQPIGTGPTTGGPDATQPGATTAPQPAPMGGIQQSQQPQGIAAQYMNPYLQSVLDPQMAEMRRQAQINNLSGLGAFTKSGAFGGGRQAIMESEAGRNLLAEQNKAIGQGYASAFDRAQQQFNAEQNQGMGLARLMSEQGAQQRGIEAEGIAADKAAFEAARENPYKMLQFQQSLLQGMPISATNIDMATPSKTQEILSGIGGGIKYANTLPSVSTKSVTDLLGNLGLSTGG